MFEYDPDKAQKVLNDHGINFDYITDVFDDPYALILDSTKPEHGETRQKIIGYTASYDKVVAVVHTDRQGNTRLISAWKASPKEQRLYRENKERLGG
jgi:uncharacterized protein